VPVCTPRAKKALQIALREAKFAGQNHVEPGHIFLGLLREGGGVAAKVLKGLGVDAAIAREEIRKTSTARNDENA
jgi:ATP-dependent Clp protease ATP-binding subunit ClpC